jgi:hypothetical protein
MFADVRLHEETLECRPSPKLFRGSVKDLKNRVSQPQCEGSLTGRGDVEFQRLLQSFGYAQL